MFLFHPSKWLKMDLQLSFGYIHSWKLHVLIQTKSKLTCNLLILLSPHKIMEIIHTCTTFSHNTAIIAKDCTVNVQMHAVSTSINAHLLPRTRGKIISTHVQEPSIVQWSIVSVLQSTIYQYTFHSTLPALHHTCTMTRPSRTLWRFRKDSLFYPFLWAI